LQRVIIYRFNCSDNTPYEKVGNNDPVSIADDVPFEIPDSWEWCRLGSLMSVISDGTHKTPVYVDKGIPFLSVQNISKGYFDFTKLKYITEEEHQKLIQRIQPQINDILFCRIGTLGKALKCTLDFEFSIFVSLGLLRPIDSELADYIVFAINSPLGDRWIQDNKVGGGTHTYKINLVDIPNMLIPIPPLAEQKRIFAKMEDLKDSLKAYENAESQVLELDNRFPEKLKKSILQQAVQGKLVPQDPNDEPASVLLERIRTEKERLIKEGKIKRDKNESVIFRRDNSHYEKLGSEERCIDAEIPFEVPDSWTWTRLGTIISLLSGQDFEPSGYNASGRGIPYITGASNIEDGTVKINRWTENPKNIARSGELLIVCKGAGVGKMAILKEDAVHIARQIMAVSPIYINIHYLQVCLEYNLEQLRKNMQGVIPGISRIDVLNILFPVPPLNEQERIVEQIKAILPMINSL